MKVEKVTAIYFSPTGNTKKTVDEICTQITDGIYKELNLTQPQNRGKQHSFTSKEAVVVGAPVYRGRVPEVMIDELKNLKGNQTPAVILVTYGNRMIDDAMLELKDTMEQQGFVVFAAASFTGQHSFNKEIGYNRPDQKDLRVADEFADKIREKLFSWEGKKSGLVVPGSRPYKKVGPIGKMPFYPETDMKCIYCMLCSQYCPMEAISFSNPKAVDPEKCIRCTACIKVCPVQAKKMTPGTFEEFVKKITTKNALTRKEPWYFV